MARNKLPADNDDDEVLHVGIRRAFWWAIIAALLVGLVILGALWLAAHAQ
jgi:hypothetical protein